MPHSPTSHNVQQIIATGGQFTFVLCFSRVCFESFVCRSLPTGRHLVLLHVGVFASGVGASVGSRSAEFTVAEHAPAALCELVAGTVELVGPDWPHQGRELIALRPCVRPKLLFVFQLFGRQACIRVRTESPVATPRPVWATGHCQDDSGDSHSAIEWATTTSRRSLSWPRVHRSFSRLSLGCGDHSAHPTTATGAPADSRLPNQTQLELTPVEDSRTRPEEGDESTSTRRRAPASHPPMQPRGRFGLRAGALSTG